MSLSFSIINTTWLKTGEEEEERWAWPKAKHEVVKAALESERTTRRRNQREAAFTAAKNQTTLLKSEEPNTPDRSVDPPIGVPLLRSRWSQVASLSSVVKHNHAISCNVNTPDHNVTVPEWFVLSDASVVIFLYILGIFNEDDLMYCSCCSSCRAELWDYSVWLRRERTLVSVWWCQKRNKQCFFF